MSTTDYQTLIDAETWAFIRQTEAAYPPDTATFSIAQQRAIYDGMCRVFQHGYPTGVTSRDLPIADVPCRQYEPKGGAKGPVIVYMHGGGFVVGGLESHDDLCAEICAATNLAVVAVDYRLCPEHPHPAAYQDCLAVAKAIAEATAGQILLAGDSAGGTLVAVVAAALGGKVQVLGQVLIYPALGGPRNCGSYLTHAHAPMLTATDIAFYAAIRHGGLEPTEPDPTANPLQAQDFTGLPPTLAIAAQCDPLADDVAAYVTALQQAGGMAHAVIETGLVHGYLRARKTVPHAARSFERITSTLTAFADGKWPFGDST